MSELAAAHLRNNNHYCRSASLNVAHPQIASPSPHSHWTGNGINHNRKRDFQFQVIEVHQGPKWFIWPSAQSKKNTSQKNYVNQENLRSVEPITASGPANVSSTTLSTVDSVPCRNFPLTSQCSPHPKNQAQLAIDNSSMPPASMGKSTPPRDMFMANTTFENDNTSVSAPSDTFKILSVARKCYADEEEDDLIASKSITINNNNSSVSQ